MPEAPTGPPPRTETRSRRPARRWLSPRRKRFWAIVLVVLYTLGGFFGVPAVVEKGVTGFVRDDLGRTATIDRVRFNPYVLSLEIDGFELTDTDGVQMAAFDRFFVNLQLSSLFRWAWTFREVQLDGPTVRFERFAPGDSRMTRLLAHLEANTPAGEDEPSEGGGLPRLLVHDLGLSDGEVHFRDDVPRDTVELVLGPATISVQELNTLPDRFGRQTVEIRLPDNAKLSWQGSIDLNPLHSEGSLALEDSSLSQTIAYLRAVMPLDAVQARLTLRTDYRIAERDDGGIDLALDGIDVDLTDLAVAGLNPSTEFLRLPALALRGGAFDLRQRELTVASVKLTDPGLTAWLSPDGELSLLGLAGAEPENSPPDVEEDPESEPWRLRLDQFQIAGGQVEFTDNQVEPPAEFVLKDLAIEAGTITNEDGAPIPVALSGALGAGGDFRFDGQVVALPDLSLSGKASVDGIPLNIAQPYVEQRVKVGLEKGAVAATADLALAPDGGLTANGELQVSDLSVSDLRDGKPLVGWKSLLIDRFEADLSGGTVGLSTVAFRQPFGRLVIHEDRSTNLNGLMVPADPTPDEPDEAPADEEAPGLVIGGIDVRDGALNFSDLSLPLPFATQVRNLNGSVSTIDTASAEPAKLDLEGQVDEYGLARIGGSINPLDPIRHTDVSMQFRNLLMSNLSPYSAEFAGREIAAGKLDLDLKYRIDAGQLKGANSVVMSDLMLGDKIESPDAADLPLGLAVALLKDANGIIDIDLPVEGDVNDPKFRIGGVIWKAFTSLITKVVTAPFRLLGKLIGVDSEDLGQFQFLAGRSDLTPPELEKIAQLRAALEQRPELNIAVTGAFDPAIDRPALQYLRLLATVNERIGEEQAFNEGEFRMLNDEIRGVLESVFQERFPETPLDELKVAHEAPPADDPEGKPVLDQLAYAADLRDRLLAAEEITAQNLEALANARAEAIRTAFLEDTEFADNRVAVEAPTAIESEDGEWVTMELGVAAD